MNKAKDITIKSKGTIANAEAIRPIPATTPEMMEYYRRYAIRLSNPIHTKGDVAYLTLASGTVEWRYAPAAVGYTRAPILSDPVLNSILQPDYELPRFRDKKLGKDGILMPLTSRDWETLSDIYGPMAIEAGFSSIYSSAVNTKGS